MKGIFLLMIVYCIVACQKDDQVAQVYENRQSILEECSNLYVLSQIPGRGNLVILRTLSDTNHLVSSIRKRRESQKPSRLTTRQLSNLT